MMSAYLTPCLLKPFRYCEVFKIRLKSCVIAIVTFTGKWLGCLFKHEINVSSCYHIYVKCTTEKSKRSQHSFRYSRNVFDRAFWRGSEWQIPVLPRASKVNRSSGARHTDIIEHVSNPAPTSTPVNELLPGSDEHVTLVWPSNKVLF